MSDPVHNLFFTPLNLPPFAQRGDPAVPDFSYPSQGGFAAIYNRQARVVARSTSFSNTHRWLRRVPAVGIQLFEINATGFYQAFTGPLLYKTATLSGDIKSDPTTVVVAAGHNTLSYAPDSSTGKLVITHSDPSFIPPFSGYGLVTTSSTVQTITATGLNNGITLTLSDPLTMADLQGWAAAADYALDYDDRSGDGSYNVGAWGLPYAAQSLASADGTIGMSYTRCRYRLGPIPSVTGSPSFKSSMRWKEVVRDLLPSIIPAASVTYASPMAKPYFDRWGAFHPDDLQWADAGYQALPTTTDTLLLASDSGYGPFGTRIKVRALVGASVRLTLTTEVDYADGVTPPSSTTATVVLPLVNGITAYNETLLPAAIAGASVSVQLTLIEMLDDTSAVIAGASCQVLYSQRSAAKIAGFINGTDADTLRAPARYAKRTSVNQVNSEFPEGYGTYVDEYSTATGDLLARVATPYPAIHTTTPRAQTVDSGGKTDWRVLVPAGSGTSTRVEWVSGFRVG